MNLGDMEKTGKLKKYKPSNAGIQKLLNAAHRRFQDAMEKNISKETRYEQAYEVILICSRIAVQASGYRVRERDGHHFISIQSLLYTLEIDLKTINYYQSVRQKRHKGLYEGFIGVSEKELDDAIKAADKLLQETKTWLTENHPHLLKEPK